MDTGGSTVVLWMLACPLLLSIVAGSSDYGLLIKTRHMKMYWKDSVRNYKGNVAAIGETVKLICGVDNDLQTIRHNLRLINISDSRISTSRDKQWFNVTIKGVEMSDGGQYICADDPEYLAVTETNVHPPRITNSSCLVYNGSILCSFVTNTKKDDFVNWEIKRTVSGNGNFISTQIACEEKAMLMWRTEDNFYVLSWQFDGDIDRKITHNFTVRAYNNFNDSNISLKVISDPTVKADPPLGLLQRLKPAVEAPMDTYSTSEYDGLINFSGAIEWKIDNTYVARRGSNLTVVCEIRIMASPRYNITKPANTRFKQRIAFPFINTTILFLGYEDSGNYVCGNDGKPLKIVDAEKEPEVLNHTCISNYFNDMKCTFFTNSNHLDLMRWAVRYSTRDKTRECGSGFCINLNCTKTATLKYNGRLTAVTCDIGNMFPLETYDFTLTATNPYKRRELHVAQKLGIHIVRVQRPSVTNISTTTTSANVTATLRHRVDPHQLFNYRISSLPLDIDQVYTERSLSATLELHGLTSYNKYQLNVSSQLADTANPAVWSSPTLVTFRTEESVPEVAAEHSATGYEIGQTSTECGEDRGIQLFWKAVPEVAGMANGVIRLYTIYLTEHSPEDSSILISANDSRAKVLGTKHSVTLCISHGRTVVAILPSTSVGYGKELGEYKVPSSDDAIKFKSCNIYVAVSHDQTEIYARWPDLPNVYNYTVYWCEYDVDNNCVDQTMEWADVGSQLQWSILFTQKLVYYKFGLSASSGPYIASGIIWAKCLNHPNKGLRVASISDIEIKGLEAAITIADKCSLNSKMADYYTVHSCKYAKETDGCIGDVQDSIMTRCEDTTLIELTEYSHPFRFWVVSHAGPISERSAYSYRSTSSRPFMPTPETVIICIFSILVTAAISIISVWLYRQRKMARKLQRPEIVKPSPLSPEQDIYPLEEEKSGIRGSAVDYRYAHSFNIAQDDRNQPITKERYPDDMRYSRPGLPAMNSYQCMESGLTSGSTENLPDDYIKYTCTAPGTPGVPEAPGTPCAPGAMPELSLSAQLFYRDTSADTGVIDISEFVNNSGSVYKTGNHSPSLKSDYLRLTSGPAPAKCGKFMRSDKEDSSDRSVLRCLLDSSPESSGGEVILSDYQPEDNIGPTTPRS